MMTQLVGRRVRVRREQLGFGRDELSRRVNFEESEALSAVETGTRPLSGNEAVRMADALGVTIEYFVDPCILVGEGAFSWRQSGVSPQDLDEYEHRAGRLIALHRFLGEDLGVNPAHDQSLERRRLRGSGSRWRAVRACARAWKHPVPPFGRGYGAPRHPRAHD